MATFQKYIVISTHTSLSRHDNGLIELRRVSWLNLTALDNLADYDAILIDLTALGATPATHVFEAAQMDAVFDLDSWLKVMVAGGTIIVMGDPLTECFISAPPLPPTLAGSSPFPIHRASSQPQKTKRTPLQRVARILQDRRPFDFRRIIRDEDSMYPNIYRYLDQVRVWEYSLREAEASQDFLRTILVHHTAVETESFAHTTFGTFLAVNFYLGTHRRGCLTLLPASGREAAADAQWILREFFEIEEQIPPPEWVTKAVLPNQQEIDAAIAKRKAEVASIQEQISLLEDDRLRVREWLRLLYDDGSGLEEIVQRAFETLGASVIKASKEKDDYRIRVEGFIEGILEVKGTHNSKFGVGSLRQLANWVDEALEAGGIAKGIFVGNAARTQELQSRQRNLFEANSEKLARVRDLAVLRAADLYCIVILALLKKLDVSAFWEELFVCRGPFDATRYWSALPKDYALG